MQDLTILTEEFNKLAQLFIQDNVQSNSLYTAAHYNTLLANKLAAFDTTCKKWLFLKLLRRLLEDIRIEKERANIADMELANCYAALCAAGHEFNALIPYLDSHNTKEEDEFIGLEYAALEDRIDMAKRYLKQEGIKDQDVYEELGDLVTFANYGKQRYAQLIVGSAASLVHKGLISEAQAATLCAIMIVGSAAKPLHHAVSFSR